jgi:lauroyl/myristoyl acyltransferase
MSALGNDFARENVDLVFPELPSEERARIVALSYSNFARTMLSLLWSATKSQREIGSLTKLVGFEIVEAEAKRTCKPLIFTTCHFGNWELSSFGVALNGRPTLIVGEDFKNPLLRPFFHGLRSRFGCEVIAQRGAAVRLLRHLKRGADVAFLFDLTMPPAPNGAIVSAFGKPPFEMSVTPLHAVLAKRAGALWVPVISVPDGNKGVRIIALAPIEISEEISVGRAVQEGWDLLQKTVCDRPDLYLWAYRHFRYKPSDTARPYPAYSQPSAAFDALRCEVKTGAIQARS